MSIVRLLPLVLVLATSWARDPIFEEVQPVIFDYIQTDYRLPPSGVLPINYEITLQPYFENAPKGKEFSFNGTVNITLQRTDLVTKTITLHAANLMKIEAILRYDLFPAIGLDVGDPQPIEGLKPSMIDYDKYRDFVILSFKDNIPLPTQAENFSLILSYNGTLMHEDLYGFYRSSYGKGDNEEWLATTQFEPTYARRAFPCWDEPAIKATFDIIIKHPSDYKAISNMQEKKPKKKEEKEKKTQDDDDIEETRFERTPVMSTYLVAFVVSKFNSNPNDDKDFTVWTKPDDQESTTFALENGQDILKELESYTNIKYYKPSKTEKSMQMSKMDQVSIPQFPAGAMENWGLVTYREPLLLSVENETSTRGIQDTMTVIAHEFAHQWFGNLVTPEWWNHIWLSEGFATFFQYFTPDSIQQDWRLMDQFVIKIMQESAFVTDASAVTRSLNQDAPIPELILHLFDNIAYKKGACVIRMMQHVLTEKVFQNALRRYLQDNMHKSVTSESLYKAMQEEAEKSTKPKISLPTEINNIMKTWVDQPGYPVITVKISNKTGDATINQQRFFLSGPSSTDKTKWYIPINYVTEEDPEIKDTKAKMWLAPAKTGSGTLKKVVKDSNKWVIFNNLQTGYYRVNYEDSNWNYLVDYLKSDNYEKIGPVSRAQLIDDSLNLARAGYLSYTTALRITLYLDKETDYIPWYAAVRAFDYMDRNLQGMENYENWQNYIAQKLKTYVGTVELTADTPKNITHIYQLGRELALEMSCRYGLEECLTYTQQRLKTWLSDMKNKLPVDLRYGILCAGVRQADQATWNTTLVKYRNNTDDPDEQVVILNALGCAQHKEVIQTFLELSLQEDFYINLFDAMNTIATNNYKSFDTLMDFIFENIEKIHEKDKDKSKLTALINQLSAQIINNDQYGKMTLLAIRQDILVDTDFEGWFRGRENLDWIEANQQKISEWVKENYVAPKPGGNSATSITSMSFLMVISVLIARFY